MNDLIQPSADCFYPRKDDPIVGQASGDKKVCESVRLRDVGFVDMEALALVVRKESLYPKTFGIIRTSFLGRLDG